jgi:YfiH family protein
MASASRAWNSSRAIERSPTVAIGAGAEDGAAGLGVGLPCASASQAHIVDSTTLAGTIDPRDFTAAVLAWNGARLTPAPGLLSLPNLMWTLESGSHPPLWRADPAPFGAAVACTTRRGGISSSPYHALNLGRSTADDPAAVAENRRRVLGRLGIPAQRLATAGQVHGARVERVTRPGHVAECDALVTTTRGLALAVTTADCMSLLYVAPGGAGAAHSGWRGTAEGMPAAALAALCAAAGCDPADVTVYLGPCIRSCCYEVGPEVASRFPAEVVRADRPRPFLDLPAAARLQLVAAGLASTSFHDSGACTACQPDWYFSHRRDGLRSGRHWGIVALAA